MLWRLGWRFIGTGFTSTGTGCRFRRYRICLADDLADRSSLPFDCGLGYGFISKSKAGLTSIRWMGGEFVWFGTIFSGEGLKYS